MANEPSQIRWLALQAVLTFLFFVAYCLNDGFVIWILVAGLAVTTTMALWSLDGQ